MKLVSAALFCLAAWSAQAQQFISSVNQIISAPNQAVAHLKSFEQLGVKTPGTPAIINTRDWLLNTYKSMGYDSVWLDSFVAKGSWQYNVIAKKQGFSNDYLVVGSHYDTKNGPGVNDNGTGVSATLSAALYAIKLNTQRSIYFVHFSGEEDGFHGSSFFVSQLNQAPGSLYMMFNLDQLGGSVGKSGNDKIYCERDEIMSPATNNAKSAAITDTIARLANLYTNLTPVLSGIYSSDYLPFQTEGHVVAGLFQYAQYDFEHTLDDSLSKVDTNSFKQAVKLASAVVIHFAQVPEFSGLQEFENEFKLYYSGNGEIQLLFDDATSGRWDVSIISLTGGKVLHFKHIASGERLDVSSLKSAMYVVRLYNASRHLEHRLKITLW